MKFYLFLILSLAGLDQGIKYWAKTSLSSRQMIDLIPGWLGLVYRENKGISLSMFADLPEGIRGPILAIGTLLIVAGLLYYLFRSFEKLVTLELWGFSLILGGALGNLIDRAFRQSVVDYMYMNFYFVDFVNNFADDLISVGFVLVLAAELGRRKNDSSKEAK